MATTFKKVEDNAASTLASSVAAAATSITVASGDGAEFPASGAFYITIYDSEPEDGEIATVSSRSTDTLTLSAGLASAYPAGAHVAVLWRAAHADDITGAINNIETGVTKLDKATVSKTAGASIVAVEAEATQEGRVSFFTGTSELWRFLVNNTASGRNLSILRYSDAGAYVGAPLTISRSTGNVTLAQGLTVSGDLTANGDVTLGNASTDAVNVTGRFIPRTVANAVIDKPAGTQGEIAWDSTVSGFVGCITTGGAGLSTWVKLDN